MKYIFYRFNSLHVASYTKGSNWKVYKIFKKNVSPIKGHCPSSAELLNSMKGLLHTLCKRVTGGSANGAALRDVPHLRAEEETPVMRSSVSVLWKVVYGLIYSAGEGRSHGSRLLWTDRTRFEGHYRFWPALGEELIVLVVFCVSARGDHLLMMLCEQNCSLGTRTEWRNSSWCVKTP